MANTRGPLHYRLLNVFTVGDDPFSGNPLCVFEDASELSAEEMQALARQLNLSETTFVTGLSPEPGVTAAVRVFTPSIELPFAGHPTLGTAHVVRALAGAGDDVVLRMPVGEVPVSAAGDRWTLTAKAPTTREVEVAPGVLAEMVGLDAADLAPGPLWVDTGMEQLLLPLRDSGAVRRARPDPALLARHAMRSLDEALVYLWAPTGTGGGSATGSAATDSDSDTVEARLFFTQDGAVVEDPATGSACANLGGWLHARGERGVHRRVHQGSALRRPSVLELEVDAAGAILVTGAVRELGRGTIRL